MKFKPTDEQLYPIDMAKSGNSLIVNAYAGTGKSTTFEFIAAACPSKKILYVTFGKENIIAAQSKFPNNVTCSTAHGLAYRYVNAQIPLYKKRLVITNLSVSGLLNALDIESEKNREENVILATLAIGVINAYCKSVDMSINGTHFLPNEENIKPDAKTMAVNMARLYWEMATEGKVYLTHDMYLKMWQVSCPTLPYDLILFDEAQDADPLMIDVINRQKAQTIVVGDEHQQIYSFRGAVNALKIFDISNHSSLTQSFRYGPRIAELANQILYKYKGFNAGIIGNNKLNTLIQRHNIPQNVVIGRTVKSLFKEMFEMQEGSYENFTCLIDVESIRSILLSVLTLNSSKSNKRPRHPFIAGFRTMEEFKLYCKYSPNDPIPTYQSLMYEHGVGDTMSMLEHIEKTKKAETVFLTAHKCKGLEFSGVSLLDDFVGPEDDDWNVEEANLMYVAGTRAMDVLSIGGSNLFLEV